MMSKDKKNNDRPKGKITIDQLRADIAKRTGRNVAPTPMKSCKKTPPFPFEVLPLKAQELIKGAYMVSGTPPDYLAISILFAAAAAAGNTQMLEVKKDVLQKAVFYMVLIGNPNSNKTGALKKALGPLLKQHGINDKNFKAEKEVYDADQAKPKKDRLGVSKPLFRRVIIQDATPEAVASALEDSPRGMAIYRDELSGFIKDFNRYHQGGEQEFWLSNWSGINLSIERKSSDPINIESPFLPIIGTIQPAVLDQMAKGQRSVNGFMDRFLFCWPEELEKPDWAIRDIYVPLLGAYREAIDDLLNLELDENGQPYVLSLTMEAKQHLFDFFNKDNKPLCQQAANDLLAGIYGKFDFHTIRLAIALHLLHWAYQSNKSSDEGPPRQLTIKTVERAIEVAKYFRAQAVKVYNSIHEASPLDKLPTDKQQLYDALKEEFQTKEGEAIAAALGMSRRSFRYFLQQNKGVLFENPKFGVYTKVY